MKLKLKHPYASTKQTTTAKKEELHPLTTREDLVVKIIQTLLTTLKTTPEGRKMEGTLSLAEDSTIKAATFPVQKTTGKGGEGSPQTEVTT